MKLEGAGAKLGGSAPRHGPKTATGKDDSDRTTLFFRPFVFAASAIFSGRNGEGQNSHEAKRFGAKWTELLCDVIFDSSTYTMSF